MLSAMAFGLLGVAAIASSPDVLTAPVLERHPLDAAYVVDVPGSVPVANPLDGFNFDNVVEVVSADEVVEFVSSGVAVDVKLTARFRMFDGSVVDFVAECDERGFVAGEEGWYVNVF